MSEQTEAKLFTNLENLVNGVTTLGAEYMPPNPNAATAALTANLNAAKSLRADFQAKSAVEETTRNGREMLFKPISTLMSAIINYGKASGWETNELDTMRSLVRQVTGKRAAPKAADNPLTPLDETSNNISAAQTSYANKADGFAQFVETVRTKSGYKPDEDQFKLITLDTQVAALNAANAGVSVADAATRQSRTALDAVLYTGAANFVDAGNASKNYLKAAFPKHPVYQSLKNIRFRKPARLT